MIRFAPCFRIFPGLRRNKTQDLLASKIAVEKLNTAILHMPHVPSKSSLDVKPERVASNPLLVSISGAFIQVAQVITYPDSQVILLSVECQICGTIDPWFGSHSDAFVSSCQSLEINLLTRKQTHGPRIPNLNSDWLAPDLLHKFLLNARFNSLDPLWQLDTEHSNHNDTTKVARQTRIQSS
jgi:hypothetical protein